MPITLRIAYLLSGFILTLVYLGVAWAHTPRNIPQFAAIGLAPVALLLFLRKRRISDPFFCTPMLLWIILEWYYSYGEHGIAFPLFLLFALSENSLRFREKRGLPSPLSTVLLQLVVVLSAAQLTVLELIGHPVFAENQLHLFSIGLLSLFTVSIIEYGNIRRGLPLIATLLLFAGLPLLTIMHEHEYAYYFFGKEFKVLHPEFLGAVFGISVLLAFAAFLKGRLSMKVRALALAPLAYCFVILQPPLKEWATSSSPASQIFMNLSGTELLMGSSAWRGTSSAFLPEPNTKHTAQYNISGISSLLFSSGFIRLCLFLAAFLFLGHPFIKAPIIFIALVVISYFLPGMLTPVPVFTMLWLFLPSKIPSKEEEKVLRRFRRVTLAVYALLAAGSLALTYHAATQVNARPHQLAQDLNGPDHLYSQSILAEDLLFPIHHGIDLARLKWTIRDTLRRGSFERGASTITMQLAKVWHLTYEKTALRKIDQMLIAIHLERTFSKRQILDQYFGAVHFGGNIIGIQAAAEHYFHKPVQDLTPNESLLLILSIENPLEFNPATTPVPPAITEKFQKVRRQIIRAGQEFDTQLADSRITGNQE